MDPMYALELAGFAVVAASCWHTRRERKLDAEIFRLNVALDPKYATQSELMRQAEYAKQRKYINDIEYHGFMLGLRTGNFGS